MQAERERERERERETGIDRDRQRQTRERGTDRERDRERIYDNAEMNIYHISSFISTHDIINRNNMSISKRQIYIILETNSMIIIIY